MRFYMHLLWRHLRQYPGRAVAALLVLAVASTMMLTLAGAGLALRFRLGGYLAQLFPEETVRLEAGRLGIGPVAIESKPIRDDTLVALRAQPEVDQLWPVETIRFPIVAEGTVFGQDISSEAVVYGVPRELVADALAPGEAWVPPAAPDSPDARFPLVASRYFLDIYNLGLARANNLPLINPKAVVGRELRLVLGESVIGMPTRAAAPTRSILCRVVGLTSQPAMIGLALPQDVVRALNAEFAPRPEPLYVQVVVRLRKGADRDAFLKAVAAQGLGPAGSDVLGGQLKTGVAVAGWILIGLAAAVFALGMLMFYLLFFMIFHARRLDLIRLRAFGVSPAGAAALALGEVGVLAGVAVAVAGGGIYFAARWATRLATGLTAELTWLPPGLFDWSGIWLAAFSLFILLATLLPALPMLWSIVRAEPAQAIRDL